MIEYRGKQYTLDQWLALNRREASAWARSVLADPAAVIYGQWSDHHLSFTWQRLDGGHRALGDCRATLEPKEELK